MNRKQMELFTVPSEINCMISLAAGNPVSILADGVDWKRFEEQVSKNRLELLVAAGLKKMPCDIVKQIPQLEKLLYVKNSFTLFNMQQIQILASVISDFASCGIRALSIKGPLLAMELYGTPELRYSHDLDILVSESDYQKACKRLEDNGFQEEITVLNKTPKRRRKLNNTLGIIHRKYFRGDMCIELHWKISHRMNEPFDEFWKRRREKVLLGHQVCCLGELDNLSYLLCHAASHGYMRMRWLFDLYELLRRPDLNWIALYNDMCQKGIQYMLFEALILLYRCPCFDMPPICNELFSIKRQNNQIEIQYRDELQQDIDYASVLAETVWPMMLMTDEERKKSNLSRKYISMLPVAGKKQNGLQLLISFFQPAEVDFQRFDFPDALYFLYYIVRPFYRLWRMTPFFIHR